MNTPESGREYLVHVLKKNRISTIIQYSICVYLEDSKKFEDIHTGNEISMDHVRGFVRFDRPFIYDLIESGKLKIEDCTNCNEEVAEFNGLCGHCEGHRLLDEEDKK